MDDFKPLFEYVEKNIENTLFSGEKLLGWIREIYSGLMDKVRIDYNYIQRRFPCWPNYPKKNEI